MFIQTEETPNPDTLKFIPGETVLDSGTQQYNSKEDAADSTLACALFEVQDVDSVFLGHDFISVTKRSDSDWSTLKTEVLTTIMEHFIAGHTTNNDAQVEEEKDYGEDQPIVDQIKELIETRVRPAVAQDGGDIIFKDYDNGVVKLQMHGACSGCPSSTITLKNGIENLLKHYVPEVQTVEAAN